MTPTDYARLVISSLGSRDRSGHKIVTAEAAAARLDQATTPDRYEIGAAIRTLGLDEAVAIYLEAHTKPSTKRVPEIMLAADVLARVGLGDLAGPHEYRDLVEWTGYPTPFACGHTSVYGFGPLDKPELHETHEGKRAGKGRRYQEKVRVNQHQCSGDVLFVWQGISETRGTPINTALVVSVDRLPDDGRTCLKIGWTG